MNDPVKVKICGLTDEEAVDAAIDAGADFLGVVFFAKSPRAVGVERAAEILQWVPEEVQKVGLFVDPSDALLNEVMNNVRLDAFQLHGDESAERVEQIRLEFGMPVIKAVGIVTIPYPWTAAGLFRCGRPRCACLLLLECAARRWAWCAVWWW